MLTNETIVAISTAPGMGAIAVIRLSGKEAIAICDKVFRSPKKSKKLVNQKANTIHFGQLLDGEEIIDEVLVSIFKSPHSYTGEDSVEVSCHGSVYIQQRIVQLMLKNGAIAAQAGEFSMRAFLNGKLDLSQAEAVSDLISSSSEAARKIAMHQMRGGFKEEISQMRAELLKFISLIELELDFAEEDVEFADRTQFKELVKGIHHVVYSLTESYQLGNVIKNGIPVAIVGEPNVGKSTLLNILLKEDKAIVSEIAGTTRDVIEDVISLQGINFRFIDTAGLRHTDDEVETIGIERAYAKIEQAEIVLLLVDANRDNDFINHKIEEIKSRINKGAKLILVVNKIDSLAENRDFAEIALEKDYIVSISAKNHSNIDLLEQKLLQSMEFGYLNEEALIITNTRHYDALKRSDEALLRVLEGLDTGISSDFLAQDVREALHYLGEITGEITTDEILGNIFSKFCIGK